MYVLKKYYDTPNGSYIKLSFDDRPFDIHDVELDYEAGLYSVCLAKTIGLPYLKTKIAFNKIWYALGNPLSKEQNVNAIKAMMGEEVVLVDSNDMVYSVSKRIPTSKFKGVQNYDGGYFHFLKQNMNVIPLRDIAHGFWHENLFDDNFRSDLFADGEEALPVVQKAITLLNTTNTTNDDDLSILKVIKIQVNEIRTWKYKILSPAYKQKMLEALEHNTKKILDRKTPVVKQVYKKQVEQTQTNEETEGLTR